MKRRLQHCLLVALHYHALFGSFGEIMCLNVKLTPLLATTPSHAVMLPVLQNELLVGILIPKSSETSDDTFHMRINTFRSKRRFESLNGALRSSHYLPCVSISWQEEKVSRKAGRVGMEGGLVLQLFLQLVDNGLAIWKFLNLNML